MTLKDEVNIMREQQAELRTDVTWVKRELNAQNKTLSDINTKLDSFISCADDKYAAKNKLDSVENKVDKINIQLAKWVGAIGILFIIIQFLIAYYKT